MGKWRPLQVVTPPLPPPPPPRPPLPPPHGSSSSSSSSDLSLFIVESRAGGRALIELLSRLIGRPFITRLIHLIRRQLNIFIHSSPQHPSSIPGASLEHP